MTDYKTFFGLSRAPFVAPAAGTDVFVAPPVATSMAAIKKALAAEDAVITVTGPVGAGKTTVTRRALESAAKFHIIVTIGRIQFGHDEVLELLLAGLGVRQLPKSTVHRFATFRRVLQQYAEQNTRVFILVEDATRVGFNALSELEAVTAADAGVSGGANLVLLGDESLPELLRDPKLARLKQRIRARQKIAAQSAGELQGYLKHCFRLAGKEFDSIFATDCCAVLHSLSNGIPRIANSLVTATLGAAAEQGLAQIDAALIEHIASDEFGLTGDHKVVDIQAAFERVSADVDFAEPKNVPEPAVALQTELVPAPEPEPEPELAPEPEPEPVPEPAVQTAEIPAPDDVIPELIQDTLPDLQILAPQLLAEDEATRSAQADHEADQTPSQERSHDPTEFELPILTGVFPGGFAEDPQSDDAAAPAPEPRLQADLANNATSNKQVEDLPAWERDPTLAQLRPDLDALERAMAAAQGSEDTDAPSSVLEDNLARQGTTPELAAVKAPPQVPEIVPEITLDKQIQAKIEEATEALRQTQVDATAELDADSDSDEPKSEETEAPATPKAVKAVVEPASEVKDSTPVVSIPDAASTRADQELEKIASELARAKTIEDVDDKMAETLFGEEFSMIAAQVAANAPAIGDEKQVAAGIPAGEAMGSFALSLEEDEGNVPAAQQAANEADAPRPGEWDTSSSQRLKVLRDLNKTAPPPGTPPNLDATESIIMSGGGVELPPAKNKLQVSSIEDQISTSMTQTLKALNINHVPQNDGDDDTGEKKGLFGLFRRK